MMTLTVRQPWAALLARGIKDVENRAWRTAYRGPLLIHAAKEWDDDPDVVEWVCTRVVGAAADEILTGRDPCAGQGRIVGAVMLADCRKDSPSPWAVTITGDTGWHWCVELAVPLLGPAVRGQLGLWDTPLSGAQRFTLAEAMVGSRVTEPLDLWSTDGANQSR